MTDTSAAAAASIKPRAPVLRQRVLSAIGRSHDPLGMTCDEIELLLGAPHQTVSPRVRELARAGLIYDTGHRRPTRTGRAAAVYAVAPIGQRADGTFAPEEYG